MNQLNRLGKAIVLSTSIVVGAATIPMLPVQMAQVEASTATKINKTSYQTTANLNLRSSASTSAKKVITIPKGKVVSATAKKSSWYKVSYTYKSNGKNVTKTGWVSGTYLEEHYKYQTLSKRYYFTKKSSQVYPTPDTKGTAIATIPTNNGFYTTLKVINSTGEAWYQIKYNGKDAYIKRTDVTKKSFVKFNSSEFQAKKNTYLYKSYGRITSKITDIPEGTIISSLKKIGNYYHVSYDGKSGYIYLPDFTTEINRENTPEKLKPGVPNSEYTEEKIADTTFTTTSAQSLLKEPNTNASAVAQIPNSTIVVATHKTNNSWYKVTHSGKTGYIPASLVKQVNTGDPMGNRDSYQFIDLRTTSPVTAKQIDAYIESRSAAFPRKSVLLGSGQAFIDAGKKYGVNPLYLAAHAIHESAFGTSTIAIGKNNLFGYGAYDSNAFISAVRFPSIAVNIEYIAQDLKSTYLNEVSGGFRYQGAYLGFRTNELNGKRVDANSEGMNFYYATDVLWGAKIANHMQNILAYDKSYYSKAKVDKTVYSSPARPNSSEVFPADIKAKAIQDLSLVTSKGATAVAATLKKGDTFTLLEKTNDYWIKVNYKDKVYWSKSVDFVNYNKYFTVYNLGRVGKGVETTLNVRKEPDASSERVTTLQLNEYVHLVLDSKDAIVTDSKKQWYKILLKDGREAWVRGDLYIERELQ